MSPDVFATKLKDKIRREWVICFASAFAFGLIAHMYKLTNRLPNWDSLVFRYDSMNMTHIGRCFLTFACGISSYYELPWLNGLLSLVYIALAAVCVCKIFNVRKTASIVLIGAVMTTIPVVTSTMAYTYTADGYFLGLLCVCLASLMMINGGKQCIGAVILITFSYGVYQAYITVAIMLLLIYLIDGLLVGTHTAAQSVKKALRFLACGIIGSLLYYGILKVILKVTGEVLTEYQGVNNALKLSLPSIVWSIKLCVKDFLATIFDFSHGASLFVILNISAAVLTVLFVSIRFFKSKTYHDPGKTVLLAVYAAAIPFGLNALYFINASMDYHNLMKYSYCILCVAFVLTYDRSDALPRRAALVNNWGVLAVGAVMVFNFIVIANISYQMLQNSFDRSYGTAIRIADRIEQTEGAENCRTIAVLGCLPGSEKYSVSLPPDMTGITDTYIIRADDPIIGQSVLTSTLNDYCGTNYEFATEEQKKMLLENDLVKNMQTWPASGSVLVADNIIVIKLGDIEK